MLCAHLVCVCVFCPSAVLHPPPSHHEYLYIVAPLRSKTAVAEITMGGMLPGCHGETPCGVCGVVYLGSLCFFNIFKASVMRCHADPSYRRWTK